MSQDLIEVFHRYFEVCEANTEALKDEVYRLRYQTYCIEHPFEDARRFPDQREVDDEDRRSVHSLVRHRPTGALAATVRLVLPDRCDRGVLLPMERLCSKTLTAAGLGPDRIAREHIGEISRFGVSKQFRRRAGEGDSITGASCGGSVAYSRRPQEARLIPHLTLGLFLAIVRMSADQGLRHWFAVMEPALMRLLVRFGIRFRPVGGLIEYHGFRQPCFGEINDVLARIWCERRNIWELITDDGRTWPAPAADVSVRASRLN